MEVLAHLPLGTLLETVEREPLPSLVVATLLGALAGASVKFAFDDLLRPFVGSRREERRVGSEFTTPLLRSAEALERRINILVTNEAHHWLEDEYFRLSTLYVFGQYLGWIRIGEQRFGFLRFESPRKGGKLNRRLHGFFRAITSHAYFRGDSEADAVRESSIERFKLTAIGEMMIAPDGDGVIDYTDFVGRFRVDDEYKSWFIDLEAFLKAATPADSLRWDRLILAGAQLRALICFLDPKGRLVRRRKISNLERLQHTHAIEALRQDVSKLVRSPEEIERARATVSTQ